MHVFESYRERNRGSKKLIGQKLRSTGGPRSSACRREEEPRFRVAATRSIDDPEASEGRWERILEEYSPQVGQVASKLKASLRDEGRENR